MTKATRESVTRRLYVTVGSGFPWAARHNKAVRTPSGFERPIVRAFQAWLEYADMHAARYESPIGEDYVLGPAWLQWGASLRTLLNGDCGNLDCETLDKALHQTARGVGFSESALVGAGFEE